MADGSREGPVIAPGDGSYSALVKAFGIAGAFYIASLIFSTW